MALLQTGRATPDASWATIRRYLRPADDDGIFRYRCFALHDDAKLLGSLALFI